MERFGFVGLPNAGKSSLYNALAGGGALAAPYAFATTDPNVGMARVPDPRLDALAEMSQSKNVVPATVQFVDIGGLVAGASKGEGLGNKFLSHIREVDAIVFVLRAFADDDVPGPVRPARAPRRRRARAHLRRPRDGREPDREAPQGGQGRQVARRRGGRARPGQGRSSRPGTPIYRSDLKDDERRLLKALLPAHQPAGDGPRQRRRGPARRHRGRRSRRCAAELAGRAEVIGMCVQLEAEAALLDADERAEMLEGLGLGRGRAAHVPPRRLQAARAAHLPHHRREGVAGLDVPGRLQGARSAPA